MKAKKLFSGLFLLLALGLLFPAWGQAQLSFKWNFPVTSIMGSLAVGPDGTIYGGTGSGRVKALNPDGGLKWDKDLGGIIFDTPAIGADGAIIVHNGLILCSLDPADGGSNWVFDEEYTMGAPAISKEGTIYICSNPNAPISNKLLAIDPATGLKLWEFIPSEPVTGGRFCNPVIDAHGTIYCLLESFTDPYFRRLYAIDPVTHNQIAVRELSKLIEEGSFSPAIGPDGTIYVGSSMRLYALAPADLSSKWEVLLPVCPPGGAPVIAESINEDDDYWIVLPVDRWIFGFESKSGTWRWSQEADMAVGTLAIGKRGVSMGGDLYYFGTHGFVGDVPAGQLCYGHFDYPLMWTTPMDSPVYSSPAVVQVGDQNVLYIADRGSVSAWIIELGQYVPPGLAPTSWPCERGNLRRNGRVSLVLSASFRVFELRRRVLDLPFAVSLVAKLESAGQSLEKEDLIPARNKLKAFINEVNALKGKKILTKEADNLIAAAQDIVTLLQ